MRFLFAVLLLAGCAHAKPLPVKTTNVGGLPQPPAVDVMNIFLHRSGEKKDGTLNWHPEGKIVIVEQGEKCNYVYQWDKVAKKGLKLVDQKCEKSPK